MTGRISYVALGPHRLRAARAHTERLAADGAPVDLVVADTSATAKLKAPPGVTLHRVPAPSLAAAEAAATRLLLGGEAPDLVIPGDPEAMPVAWTVARKRKSAQVRFEPGADLERRPAAADLAVVTPWYPSPNDPFSGSFVQTAVQAVQGAYDRVSVLHTQEWGMPRASARDLERLRLTADRIAERWGNGVVEDLPEGELTRVTAPVVTRGTDYAERVDGHVQALAAALPTGQIEAPLVHAHTGIYGGVVAATLARPDARLVVTEHASFLLKVFNHRASRRRYEMVLDRADLVLCVSKHLHDLLRDRYPAYRDKLRIVPNVVDFAAFPARPEPPADLLRWLYVGRMLESKGVARLVDAFARVAAEEPRATLTLVGSGTYEDALRRQAAAAGVADRVEQRPPVPPDRVAAVMHEHDLLVHASPAETFGLTVVEAVATGTPVLVARSEGPAETLAGLEGVAGVTFDVSDDPQVIVDGYRDLRARRATLDPVKARQTVLERYGAQPVRARLLEAYRPDPVAAVVTDGAAEPAADAVDPDRPRVVMLAMGPLSKGAVRGFVRAMTDRGYAVDLVTSDTALSRSIAKAGLVRGFSIESAESRGLLVRGEQFFVYKVPGKLLATALSLSRRQAGLTSELTVRRVQSGYRRVAGYVHAKVFGRGYGIVRPLLLWRIARRDVLPHLDIERTRRVVVSGASGTAIGWRLARRHPDLTVTTSTSAVFDD